MMRFSVQLFFFLSFLSLYIIMFYFFSHQSKIQINLVSTFIHIFRAKQLK